MTSHFKLVEIRELSQQPNSFDAARQAVLRLPGIENYLPDVAKSPSEIDEGLDRMAVDVSKQLDAENMVDLISNCLGWSDKQKDDFFSNPERASYRSKLELSNDFPDRMNQFLTVGSYLRLRYQQLKSEAGSQDGLEPLVDTARENLAIFYENSMYNLFQGFTYDFTDKVKGIDPDKRHDGSLYEPSDDILALMEEEAKRVALKNSSNPQQLLNEVLVATENGNYATITSFLTNNSGKADVRETLEAIVKRRINDRDLSIEQLQILWATEVYKLVMGIDMETYYEIKGMPKGDVIDTRLHTFLKREDLIAEFGEHLSKEAGKAIDTAGVEGRPVTFFEILRERAKQANDPDAPSEVNELEERKKRVWAFLRETIPLSMIDSPRVYMDAPIKLGANLRGVNITYNNVAGQQVNVIVLNPRDNEDRFKEVGGHEGTHRVHSYLLDLADRKAVERGEEEYRNSNDRVPKAVKEEFSQLVQNAVTAILKKDGTGEVQEVRTLVESKVKREWPNLLTALSMRRQASYAFVQRGVRLAMEGIWKSGFHKWLLPEENAASVLEQMQKQVVDWHKEGYDIMDERATPLNNVNILSPDDGLVYLTKYVADRKPVQAGNVAVETRQAELESKIDMREAFEARFTQRWLLDKDARAILLALLIHTRDNYDISTYGEFVKSADLTEIRNTLESLGITEDLI